MYRIQPLLTTSVAITVVQATAEPLVSAFAPSVYSSCRSQSGCVISQSIGLHWLLAGLMVETYVII
jgi:hypothetical protein